MIANLIKMNREDWDTDIPCASTYLCWYIDVYTYHVCVSILSLFIFMQSLYLLTTCLLSFFVSLARAHLIHKHLAKYYYTTTCKHAGSCQNDALLHNT